MRKSIPWRFVDLSQARIWRWETPHFEARIIGEGEGRKLFSWSVVDRSTGVDLPFESGSATTFPDASDGLLEVVGKSYPRELGYTEYAGSLATTFMIGEGSTFDFGPVIGNNVQLNYLDDDGMVKIVTGSLSVENHFVTVRMDAETVLQIPPARIRDIQAEYDRRSLVQRQREQQATAAQQSADANKVYRYEPGCTGRPGVRRGTVVHNRRGPFCPVHNV